jgi:flagellar protein FlaI
MATTGEPEVQQEATKGGGLTNSYLKLLMKIKSKPMTVRVPERSDVGQVAVVTEILRIDDAAIDEVEVAKIAPPYTFVRIRYDNTASEYLYEVIEPTMTEDEKSLLDVLKRALVLTLNLADADDLKEKEAILRSGTESLMKQMSISLNPISKERITYYLKRDFIGYGVIALSLVLRW